MIIKNSRQRFLVSVSRSDSSKPQNNSFLPYLNEFTVIENFGKVNLGGDILRASFKNDNDESMQGIFTATVYDPGPYYMYGVDLAPLNVYHIVMMFAPDEQFNDWMEIMDYCMKYHLAY